MADHLNAPGPITTSSLSSEDAQDSTHLTSASPSSAKAISPTPSVRSPGVRARPRLPAGPRTRKSTNLVSSKGDHNGDHAHSPPLPDHPAWTNGVQLTNPFPPTPVPPAPPAPHQPDASSTPQIQQHPDDHDVVTTSRPGTPTPIAAVSPFPSAASSRKPSHATVHSTTVPPLNLPAAQLNLTPEPLPYKYLTLDAAHWTLTSTELQSLVSSAIRESAKEQFIRLLPLSIIDVQIPEDVARIERSWDTAAARWRFEAHRRNMLLRALAASGADIDLLSQLSGTLGTLDSHAQDLLQASAHRTQISAACDTHRASALAVALRKLNASYARRTRDLDKARANISTLRSEVEEAWKVAEEQAAEVDKLKSLAARLQDQDQPESRTAADTTTDDDENTLEDDASDSALPDGASISRAQVVDVTGTAVAAQARLTTMPSPSNPGCSPGTGSSTPRSAAAPPPSAFAATATATAPSDASPLLPSSASQVSRVSAARRRSTRKSKASLRLPASIAVRTRSRSRSVLRGEVGISRKATRSKSRSRKGKERDASASALPLLAADVSDSFLEMEVGRPAGEEEADVDADADADADGTAADGDDGAKSQTVLLFPEAPNGMPSTSTMGIAAPLSTPGHHHQHQQQQEITRHSSASSTTPSSSAAQSVLSSTPTFPTSSSRSGGAAADYIPDPASIFANATMTSLSETTTTTTTTTTTSALEIAARRGHSLDLPSSPSGSGKHHHHHHHRHAAAGAKIRRSISELLSFGSSSARSRRRSLPFTFKGRSNSTRNNNPPAPVPGTSTSNGVGSSPLQQGLVLNVNDAGEEDGWEEDTARDEEGAAVA